MATNYHKTVRDELKRILESIEGIAIVYPYALAYEECHNYPAISFRLDSSLGGKASLLSEMRTNKYIGMIATKSNASATATEQLEELDCLIRETIEQENRTRTSRDALGADYTLLNYNLSEIYINPDKPGDIEAIAMFELEVTFRRSIA